MDIVLWILLGGAVLSLFFTLDSLLIYLVLMVEERYGSFSDLPAADQKKYFIFLRRGLALFGLSFLFLLVILLLYSNLKIQL